MWCSLSSLTCLRSQLGQLEWLTWWVIWVSFHIVSRPPGESSKRTMSKTSKFYKATVQVSHNVTSTILYLSKRVTRQPRLDSTSWCEKLQNVCGCFYIPKGLVCKSVFLPTAQDFLFIENKLLLIKIFDLNAEEWLVDKCRL